MLRPNPRSRRRRWLAALANGIVALVVVILTQALLVKPFDVPSESMSPVLLTGDRILVSRMATPHRGDVVVFAHGATWGQQRLPPTGRPASDAARAVDDLLGLGPSNRVYTVKRVVGIAGDLISCCSPDGRVVRNGHPLAEPYVTDDLPFVPGTLDCASGPRSTRCFPATRVPAGTVLVLGDHRVSSSDSVIDCRGASGPAASCVRFVALEQIVGRVVARFWPLDRAGPLLDGR